MEKLLLECLIVLIIAITTATSGTQLDQTVLDGSIGCDVAKAAVDIVQNTQVFDFRLAYILNRVAAIGEYGKTVGKNNESVGIWRLTEDDWTNCMKHFNSSSLNMKMNVNGRSCVSFEDSVHANGTVPLLASLCVHLLLDGEIKKGSLIPPLHDNDKQITFYKAAVKTDADFVKNFPTAVKEVEKSGSCYECKMTFPTDIYFILDASEGMKTTINGTPGSTTKWDTLKEYTNQIIGSFKKVDGVQMGFATYPQDSGVSTTFTTPDEVVKKLDAIKDLKGVPSPGPVIANVYQLLSNESNQRLRNYGVKIVVFLIMEKDIDTPEWKSEFEKSCSKLQSFQSEVLFFAIGMKGVDKGVLKHFAPKNNGQYVQVYQDDDKMKLDSTRTAHVTCWIPRPIDLSRTPEKFCFDLQNLQEDNVRYFEFLNYFLSESYLTDVSGKFKSVHMHASFRNRHPSEVSSDHAVQCTSTSERCIFLLNQKSLDNAKQCMERSDTQMTSLYFGIRVKHETGATQNADVKVCVQRTTPPTPSPPKPAPKKPAVKPAPPPPKLNTFPNRDKAPNGMNYGGGMATILGYGGSHGLLPLEFPQLLSAVLASQMLFCISSIKTVSLTQ